MNRLLTAFSIVALAVPAHAGGLAPERSPRPPERPPLVANVCQHIPWTECGVVRGDGPTTGPTAPRPSPRPVPVPPDGPVSPPPVKEPPAPSPCHVKGC
jgi:hypothetical protein